MAKSRSSSTPPTAAKEPNAVVKYFYDTRAELRRVTWPTREETRKLTIIIVVVTLAMAIFLGTLDYIFQGLVAGIIIGSWLQIGVSVILFAAGVAAFYYNSQEA